MKTNKTHRFIASSLSILESGQSQIHGFCNYEWVKLTEPLRQLKIEQIDNQKHSL